jgi:hypothetical protein
MAVATVSVSARDIATVKSAVAKRLDGAIKPSGVAIVEERAIRLFEDTMEATEEQAEKLSFWEAVAFLKAAVLKKTAASKRGRMAVLFHVWQAAMMRGFLADEDGNVRPLDVPNAERVAQAHAYLACSASLS